MVKRMHGAIALIGALLLLTGCGGDSADSSGQDSDPGTEADDDSAGNDDSAGADDSSSGGQDAGPSSGSAGTMILGDEEITIDQLLCYFEEQPRAGLGGVFTHTAQGSGVNSAGEPVILDMSRARGDDGVVEDDIIIDIGDYTSDDSVSLFGGGAEGTISFGDSSVSLDAVEVSDFESGPLSLSFDMDCG